MLVRIALAHVGNYLSIDNRDCLKAWLLSLIRNMQRHIIGVSPTIYFVPACVSDNPFRRATCYLQTLRYRQAIADFKKLLTLEPQNQLVRMQMDSTQKIFRKVEFEKVHRTIMSPPPRSLIPEVL